jgi:hypothetical protein
MSVCKETTDCYTYDNIGNVTATACGTDNCICDGTSCISVDCAVNGDCTAFGPDSTCANGTCTTKGCATSGDCWNGSACNKGICYATKCTDKCADGFVCKDGYCVADVSGPNYLLILILVIIAVVMGVILFAAYKYMKSKR